MATIKVGDTVMYRPVSPGHIIIAVTGARVVELGETEDGKPAARLDCGRLGELCVLVEHLHLEQTDT